MCTCSHERRRASTCAPSSNASRHSTPKRTRLNCWRRGGAAGRERDQARSGEIRRERGSQLHLPRSPGRERGSQLQSGRPSRASSGVARPGAWHTSRWCEGASTAARARRRPQRRGPSRRRRRQRRLMGAGCGCSPFTSKATRRSTASPMSSANCSTGAQHYCSAVRLPPLPSTPWQPFQPLDGWPWRRTRLD